MNDPQKKIYIPGPRPGEMIECTQEELKDYAECLKSKYIRSMSLTMLTSTIVAIAAPIKNQGNIVMKRTGIGCCCFFMGQIFSNLYSASSCMPVLQKLFDAKAANRTEQMPVMEPSSETNEVKQPDFTPVSLSDLDLSPPSSFSLDPGFKIYTVDEEKEVSKVTESRPLTYEELRMKSREEFKQRPYGGTLKTPGSGSDRKDDDDKWDGSSSTWPRKTNIYGDPVE